MKVPALTNREVIQRATLFLHKYNPSYDYPIPIEEIADQRLDIHVFPIQHLEKLMGIDGSITKDFKTIEIDEYVYISQYDRARFTIAHEIGHFELHRELFDEKLVDSVETFIEYQNSMSVQDWGSLEKQAFVFAQEVLMPRDIFTQEMDARIGKLGGIDRIIISDLPTLISQVREIFDVSQFVALSKLKHVYPQIEKIAKFIT